MKLTQLNRRFAKKELWNGCLLASIAHAIMVAHYPELDYEHSWDGLNYSTVDVSGGRATITFTDTWCVGAVRLDRAIDLSIPSAMTYFQGAPQEVIEWARKETLEYLLDEDEDGETRPCITTGFWGDDEQLFSRHSLVAFIQNGGFLFNIQLMDDALASEAWREYYDMNNRQVSLMESLFRRKIHEPGVTIHLTSEEIGMIGSMDPEGIRESKQSFEEIGIIW